MNILNRAFRIMAKLSPAQLILLVSLNFLSHKVDAGTTDPNNLWDLSQGVEIIDHSPVQFDIRNMFGGTFDAETNTIFADGLPNKYVHSVEWTTPSLIDLSGLRLFASGDGAEYGNSREFAKFDLFAKAEGEEAYTLLMSYVPPHPYEVLDENSSLILVTNFGTFTAKEFRAEFTQRTVRGYWDAPRINCLQAIAKKHVDTPVGPEVASATAFVVNGFVVAINVNSGGSNYLAAPKITISGGGGSGATANAIVKDGSVVAIIVTSAGSGYTSAPTVTISLPTNAIKLAAIEMMPRLLIRGMAGTPVQVQYAIDEAYVTNWQVLTELVLPSDSYYLFDTNAIGGTQRKYRVLPMGSNK